MSLVWLLIALLLLLIGSILLEKGVCAAAGRIGLPSLAVTFLALMASGAAPGIVLAAAASAQRQSAFLLLALISAGIFNILLYSGLTGLVCPYMTNPVIRLREYPVLLLALILVAAAGRGTFAAGHPDGLLDRRSGIIFLALAAAEALLLLVTAMKGYRRKKNNRSWPFLLALLFAAIGFCLMVCGGYKAADQVNAASGKSGLYPGIWGFFAAGIFCGLRGLWEMLRESRTGGNKTSLCVFGPSVLMFTGGLGAACLIAPVSLSYPAELAAVMGIAVLLWYGLVSVIGKRIGRIAALLLLAAYAAAAAVLGVCMVHGLY